MVANGGTTWVNAMPNSYWRFAIWGNSKSDIFTVGNDILHSDGVSWRTQYQGAQNLVAVRGVGADVYAVSDAIVHTVNGGATWTVEFNTNGLLNGVAVTTDGEVYVVGDQGVILHKP